jgi:hypothetical protein
MKTIVLTCLLAFGTSTFAQCPTAESFVKDKKTKDAYGVNSQSRSGSVKPGETYEMSFIAQAGMDYRLTSKSAVPLSGSLSYEVYEMVVEKKAVNGKDSYKRTKHVLATSTDGSQPLEFTTDKTRKIFVSVTLAGGDPKKTYCIGILVEDKKTTKLGF